MCCDIALTAGVGADAGNIGPANHHSFLSPSPERAAEVIASGEPAV
jgi:hypothetical protein